ncbi:NUDIX domain-containing protein [Oceanospirillum sp.]|uniref:NUDIX domain-containing protein n=1 Tax=Oceanospirillum sp. TaxID=2021254 RepID=UPI003A92C068
MSEQLTPTFAQDSVEILEKHTVFQGFFRFDKLRIKTRKFAGGWSGVMSREVFVRGNAVGVLLYDPITDQLLMVEQFRPGCLYEPNQSPWQFELVAGMTEPGESNEDVVHREAEEEAGCKVLQLEHLYKYWVSPGGMDEQIDLFLGIIDSREIQEGIYGLAEENEDIRVELVSAAEAFRGLQDGRINNAMAIIGLQWLQLNRVRLQETYGA